MDGPFSGERTSHSFDYAQESGYVRAQPQKKGFRGTQENAKTKLCMRWLAGDCRFGPRCNFAHGERELRKMPPKPGRYSHDTRDREIDKEMLAVDASAYAYGRASYDASYGRAISGGRSSMYSVDYYPPGQGAGHPYPGGHGGSYHGQMYATGPPTMSYHGGPSPSVVQPSGPLHVAAATARVRDYYPGGQYPVVGPNGWTMYRDPKSGEPYYHNHQLSITQWKRPDEWPLP